MVQEPGKNQKHLSPSGNSPTGNIKNHPGTRSGVHARCEIVSSAIHLRSGCDSLASRCKQRPPLLDVRRSCLVPLTEVFSALPSFLLSTFGQKEQEHPTHSSSPPPSFIPKTPTQLPGATQHLATQRRLGQVRLFVPPRPVAAPRSRPETGDRKRGRRVTKKGVLQVSTWLEQVSCTRRTTTRRGPARRAGSSNGSSEASSKAWNTFSLGCWKATELSVGGKMRSSCCIFHLHLPTPTWTEGLSETPDFQTIFCKTMGDRVTCFCSVKSRAPE